MALSARYTGVAEAAHPGRRRGDRRRCDRHSRRPAGTDPGPVRPRPPADRRPNHPAHHDGQRPAPRAAPPGYTRVTSEVVVELSADLAVDGPRWRHPVRFVRVRGDVTVADLAGEMRMAEGISRGASRGWAVSPQCPSSGR